MTPSPAGALKPLVLTMGEPAGIGGEITLKAWLGRDQGLPPFVALDDPARLEALAADLGLEVPVHPVETPDEAACVFAAALPVLPRTLDVDVVPGEPDPEIVFCKPCTQPLPVKYRVEGDALYYEGVYSDRARDPGADVDLCFSGKITVSLLRL